MKLRTPSLLVLGAAALSLTALTASAQGPADGPPPGHRPHPPSPIFEALDTNHDGVLSADEIKNASASLMTLDKNKDGKLTEDEMRPARPHDDNAKGGPDADKDDQRPPRHHGPEDHAGGPKPDDAGGPGGGPKPDDAGGPAGGPPHHHGPPPLIAALDANHDGVISADEIANAAAVLKTLDKNGDGQLTRDELRPVGPPPPHPED